MPHRPPGKEEFLDEMSYVISEPEIVTFSLAPSQPLRGDQLPVVWAGATDTFNHRLRQRTQKMSR